jgi:hypothetical protein
MGIWFFPDLWSFRRMWNEYVEELETVGVVIGSGRSGIMKLVKSICMMCWQRFAEEETRNFGLKHTGWSSWDDANWIEGKVMCPKHTREHLWKKGDMPDDCTYRLEHLVSQ